MKYLGPISDPKDMVNKEYVDNNASGHEELTQAEYNALSQAEKENGTVYFITDGDPEYTVVNDSVPIGAIQAYAGDTPPFGWLFCDGTAVSRTTYSDLFAAIGTTYGSGDGSTTFNVPDLKGRTLVGVGNSGATGSTNHTLGQKAGEETHKLEESEMPKHRHGIRLEYGATANPSYPPGSSYAQVTGTTNYGYNYTNNPIEYIGGDGSHNNMQPYTVANYIIKALETVSSSMLKQLDPQSILFDALYPVGSYYETSDSTFNPNEQWSGTWENTSTDIADHKKLLWTNPSPGSSFPAQNIALNLTAYNIIEVSFFIWTGLNYVVTTDKGVINGSPVMSIGAASSISGWYNGYVDMIARSWSASSTQVHFDGGAEGNPAAQSATTNPSWLSGNHVMIPHTIYGIKQTTSYNWHRIA